MKTRRIPEAGALYEQLRRPIMMLIVGVALTAPAGALRVREEKANVATATETVNEPALAEKLAQAKQEEGVISRVWEENARERERRVVTASLAKHFNIAVPLAEKIHDAAAQAEIDPEIAFGLVRTESGFDSRAVSHVGAIGLTQVMPRTASWFRKGTTRSALFNEDTNLDLGLNYLRYLLDKYDGNTRLALTAYNRGPGTVDRLLRRGRNPENGYATKVLSSKPGRRI